jgi:SAM-dependent methyltransferase
MLESNRTPNTAYQNLVTAHFDATTPEWEEVYTRQGVYATAYQLRMATVLSLLDNLSLPVDSRCLEIGCGPGLTTIALAERGYVVNAIDPVKAMVRRTQQRAIEARLGDRIFAGVGDVHNLSFPDSKFDLVLMIGVTEWLKDLRKPLQEVSRILKPGAYVIIACDNKWALHKFIDPLLNPAFAPLRRTLRNALNSCGLLKNQLRNYCYSIRQFDALLFKVSLEKVEGVTLGFGPFSFFRLNFLSEAMGLWLQQRLQYLADGRFPLIRSGGVVYVAVAKKILSGT